MTSPCRKRVFVFLVFFSLNYTLVASTKMLVIKSDTLSANQNYMLADSLSALSSYEDAIAAYQEAATEFEQTQIWPRLADCLFKLSGLYIKKYNLEIAEDYANKILNECVPKIQNPDVYRAKAYHKLGAIATRKRELEKALDFYEKAIQILSSINNQHPYFIDIYPDLGMQYYMQGDIDKSLNTFNDGLKLSISIHGVEALKTATFYNNLANIYFRARKEFSRARIYYEKAISIRIKKFGAEHNSLISPYANIGALDVHLGNYAKSNFYNQKALQLILTAFGPNHPYVGMIYLNINESYRKQGKYQDALSYLYKALNFGPTKSQPLDLTKVHLAISKNNTFLENYEKAIEHAQIALSLCKDDTGEKNDMEASSYDALSFAYLNSGNYEKVIEMSGRAKLIYSNLYGRGNNRTSIQNENIGIAYQKLGQYDLAIAHYDSALSFNFESYSNDQEVNRKESPILNPLVHLQVMAQKTDCLVEYFLSNGDEKLLDRAIEESQLADSLIVIFRSSHYNEIDKITFSKEVTNIYEHGIRANFLKYIEAKDDFFKNIMFSYVEKTKSNQLKSVVHTALDVEFSGPADSLIEREKLIAADIRYLQSELARGKSESHPLDSATIKSHKSKIFELSRSHEDLINTMKTEYPDYFNLKINTQTKSLAEVQNLLDSRTTLIEYFVGVNSLYTFVVDKDSLYVHEQKITEDLNESVESLQTAIINNNYEDYLQNGYALYQLLIQPVKDKIVGDRLIIIPDDELWHVNFDLLLTSNQKATYKNLNYLMKDHAISYGYSSNLMVLESERKNPLPSNKGILAFSFNRSEQDTEGNTISMQALRGISDDLPGSRAEIEAISELVDGDYYYGNLADKANFKKNAQDYSILHLAVHGSLDEDHPMNSKLQFTTTIDSIERGALYAYELYNMSLNADLAVLSACNTGSGQIAKGEGIMSLGRAFTYAGCKSLILTQWELPDASTSELMRAFYQGLKDGLPKDIALQQAKLQYLADATEPMSSPLYWGSFIFLGDSIAIDLDKGSNVITYSLVAFVFVMIVGIARRRKLKSVLS